MASPMATPTASAISSRLELFSTKYVEVYKGANALRFGANSLGGAINLVTKAGYDAGLIELRSEAGSFGFLKELSGHGPGVWTV